LADIPATEEYPTWNN